MAKFELKLPKMGESVAEATLTAWLKEVGDTIELDEPVVEIATDKVDSEVPSEVEGTLIEKFFDVDDVVQVGQTIAIIEIEGENEQKEPALVKKEEQFVEDIPKPDESEGTQELEKDIENTKKTTTVSNANVDRFYSPLVKNIAQEEGIPQNELDTLTGSGLEGRVTKDDILAYVKQRGDAPAQKKNIATSNENRQANKPVQPAVTAQNGDEIIQMSRMGKLVAKHMMNSIQTSAHVQSFIEVDVTNLWNWRNKVKTSFEKREGEKITFTPIFMEAVARTIRDFPLINIQLDGDSVIKKKNINLGMAAALADGNLIVPVIKNADQLNLVGMIKAVNDLATRARTGRLKPEDTQEGTYTVTNVGTFGSIMGTPIINQPQVAILALGAIRKIPSVIETDQGDFIGIRYKMFLTHSYDHRVVNGALGGMFVQRVAHYLEDWDVNREV